MSNVKSVYNFVPAPSENEVFKPDWAKNVSHDVPFKDGESGEIEIELEAKTPIFVRNGHTREDAENKTERYLSFSKHNGKYFIPATSIKGMVRSVLEIMSFSRLKAVNDIFSFRDLNNNKFKNEVAQNSNLKTGWLEKVGEFWVIKECDFGRIEFKKWNQSEKSAVEKYCDYFVEKNPKKSIESFTFIEKLDHNRGELFRNDNQGKFKGYQVFFGSINNKKYEYIFAEPKDDLIYDVDSDLIERFKDIDIKNDDTDNIDTKTQWQYLNSDQNPYPNDRIPVFFKEKDGKVEHFGFSRLYKISNTKYLNELNPLASYYNRNKEYEFDLAETIFGTVEDTDDKHGKNRNTKSLKGRVFFGHSFAVGEVRPNEPVGVVLASPKASYYPFYLENSKTYLDDDATLKGFKKYPVHSDNSTKPSNLNTENKNIQTQITPLPSLTRFSGKVRFSNLKKVEVGALLSAITLHKHNDLLCHNLGSAKPLGFGKVKITAKLNFDTDSSIEDYIAAFEETITKDLKRKEIDWIKSDAMKELYNMSKDPLNEFLLKYPELEFDVGNSKKTNEFNKYRNEGLSSYSGGSIDSFNSVSEKLKLKIEKVNEQKAEEDKIAKEKAKQEKRDQIIRQKEEERKKAEELNKQKQKRLIEEGLKDLVNNESFSKGEVLIRKYRLGLEVKKITDETQLQFIRAFVTKCVGIEKNNLWSSLKRNNWKKLSSHVDKNILKQWFDELIDK